jgi:2-C-methyl-D-erythritol 2,4-cyclodiphosphate synthase
MKVGHGFDMHRTERGRQLVIGGVDIPWTHGLAGHSDADVLVHAVCDALLGAAGLGDLGSIFPDTDVVNENRDSREFLRSIGYQLTDKGFRAHNIDCTLVTQEPRFSTYFAEMQSNLESDLLLSAGSVHVKATTTEHLGAIGRGEGMAAFAVALIEEIH